MAYRHGSPTGFFDGVTTYVAGATDSTSTRNGGLNVPAGPSVFSIRQEIGRGSDNFSFYVNVTSAPAFTTQWVLQAAHSGAITAQATGFQDPNNLTPNTQGGIFADPDSTTYVWHDVSYLGSLVSISTVTGGGLGMNLVPDFVPGWVRLRRADTNGAVTVIAGWEIQSD